MVTTELHAGQQRPKPMIWVRPAAPEISIEWLLGLIPTAEAKLYDVLTELIPSPRVVAPNLAGCQIKMAELAKLAGLSRRWVIELLPRLEKRDLIRTQGGRGAAKWIWLLPLGVPRLGKSFPTELTQKEASPEPILGKAKAQRAAAQPKRRRQETAQSAKVAPPAEKPTEIPKKTPLPSTSPTDRSPKGPVLATMLNPPPPTAPGNLAVPAAAVTPPPSTTPGRAVLAPKVMPPPPASGNTVVPAARVTPPPMTTPAVPAKPASRRRTQKLPAGRHWESAPIEELVGYACSLPVTPELIGNLITPGMTGGLLVLALERLCQQIERNERKPCRDRWSLISALRTTLADL